MKLTNFAFFADENISPVVVGFLRNNGCDVKDAHGANMVSAKDTDWLALAYTENRVIITQDSDFSQLVFTQPINFIGIIFLRPGSFYADFHIQTLSALLAENIEVQDPFIITAKNSNNNIQVKIRHF